MRLLVCLFISMSMFGQRTVFKGQLADKTTQEPVVYANISFLNSDRGISSTESGSFEMYISKQMLESKVHISCLNYKDTIVLAKDMLNKTLFLTPKTVMLNEIVLSKKVDRTIVLDRVKKRVNGMHSKGMRMIAKYFPNNKKYGCCQYISAIDIHFERRQTRKSKFRIRIFDKDSVTGLPNADILTLNLPITIKKNETNVQLDLSDYDIEMPSNGFFIAFEKLFIPFNEYGRNPEDPSSEVFYSPVVGMTKYRYKKEKDRVFLYVKGAWRSIPMKGLRKYGNFAPAIAVTLSN